MKLGSVGRRYLTSAEVGKKKGEDKKTDQPTPEL